METLTIHTPFIQLNQALKLMGWVESGAMANEVIDQGLVFVNQVKVIQSFDVMPFGFFFTRFLSK